MPGTRSSIASAAADGLAAAWRRGLPSALVGFDGFIDSIIEVVDRRRDMSPDGFDRLRTIPDFAARAGAAAGRSANIELVVRDERFGGNGPLMAGALGRLGARVTYIGAVGDDSDPGHAGPVPLHPIYEPFARRCERVIATGPPARTDALEFDDGKLMLGKPANVQRVTWDRLMEVIGLEGLRAFAAEASLIAIVNWTLSGGVESIWRGLIDRVLPGLPPDPRRRIFIDLSDPAKRTDADLARALAMLREMNSLAPVTLGLNHAEGDRVASVLGVGAAGDAETLGAAVERTARQIRAASGLECVAIHPREGAAAATAGGDSAWFDGPFTARPRLSTGAGDHFNAGFALGRACGLPLAQCLAAGCATSGVYVRDAQSPTLDRLTEFLRSLPGADATPPGRG